MFIARKPHQTGINLYCLACETGGYVVERYLCTGARGTPCWYGTAAGNCNPMKVMNLWASLLPQGSILCADSFFGSHELAKELAVSKRPFLMMTKRSVYGVSWAGGQVHEGQTAAHGPHGFQVEPVRVQRSQGGAQTDTPPPPRLCPC